MCKVVQSNDLVFILCVCVFSVVRSINLIIVMDTKTIPHNLTITKEIFGLLDEVHPIVLLFFTCSMLLFITVVPWIGITVFLQRRMQKGKIADTKTTAIMLRR